MVPRSQPGRESLLLMIRFGDADSLSHTVLALYSLVFTWCLSVKSTDGNNVATSNLAWLPFINAQ